MVDPSAEFAVMYLANPADTVKISALNRRRYFDVDLSTLFRRRIKKMKYRRRFDVESTSNVRILRLFRRPSKFRRRIDFEIPRWEMKIPPGRTGAAITSLRFKSKVHHRIFSSPHARAAAEVKYAERT